MSAYKVVCYSHLSDRCIRICISHPSDRCIRVCILIINQIAVLRYVSRTNNISQHLSILHQSYIIAFEYLAPITAFGHRVCILSWSQGMYLAPIRLLHKGLYLDLTNQIAVLRYVSHTNHISQYLNILHQSQHLGIIFQLFFVIK